MKKYKLMILFCISLLLTGCLKYDYQIAIDKNGNIDFQLEYGVFITKDGYSMDRNQGLMESRMQSFGYDTEYVEKDDYQGMIYRRRFNLDDNCSNKPITIYLPDAFNNKDCVTLYCIESENKKVYDITLNWEYGMLYLNNETNNVELINSTDGREDIDIAPIYSDYQLSFKVSLPVKPINTNATKISDDGMTLEWELQDQGVQELKFSFTYADPIKLNVKRKNNEEYSFTPEIIYPDDEITLKIKPKEGKEIDKLIIKDEKNNTIDYRKNEEDYIIKAPVSDINVDIQYKVNNPETSNEHFLSIIFLFGSLILLLISQVMYKQKQEFYK